MSVKIAEDWKKILQKEFESPYFQELIRFVRREYQTYNCYPKGKNIFAAFDACPFENLKIVIIGQDPYHGAGQANGRCNSSFFAKYIFRIAKRYRDCTPQKR